MRKGARIGRSDAVPMVRSAERKGCSLGCRSFYSRSFCSRSTKAVTQAAAAGRRHGATRACSGVLLQRLGVMRGKRQDRPDTGSGRCSLAARAQSEASQLEADYGACQGLKSSVLGVWPHREWAGLLVCSQSAGAACGAPCSLLEKWNPWFLTGPTARIPATSAAQRAQASRLSEQVIGSCPGLGWR